MIVDTSLFFLLYQERSKNVRSTSIVVLKANSKQHITDIKRAKICLFCWPVFVSVVPYVHHNLIHTAIQYFFVHNLYVHLSEKEKGSFI